MKKLFVILSFFVVLSFSSFAQAQNFTLVNGTDFVITHVYITPAASEDWGEDVLNVDVLGSGESSEISFEGYDDCAWAIQAVAEDGSTATWEGIDLCKYYTITLTMTNDGPVALME